MSALALVVILSSAPGEPSPFVPTVAVELVAQARAAPDDLPFAGVLGVTAGFKVGVFRAGLAIRGEVTGPPARAGLDLGGAMGFDVFSIRLERRFDIAFTVPVEAYARWHPARAVPWSALVLGGVGLRILGVRLSVVFGAESGPLWWGVMEGRLGVDLLELCAFVSESRQR